MSFFDTIFSFLSSLFGGNKEVQQAEQKEDVKVNTNDYEIPAGVKNFMQLMKAGQKLTDEEMADLENQIKTLGSLGYTHYVIHTHDRGETSALDWSSGDRYWELDYLPRAKTMDVITDSNGMSRQQTVDKGLEPIIYENLLS